MPEVAPIPVSASLPTFDDFWLLFPRHVAKKDAARAWMRLTPERQIDCLVGLVAWLPVWQHECSLREDALDYVPHPATWINGERFEDELPVRFRHNGGAHKPVAVPINGKGVAMPEHVKAMLSKLREKR